jgi:molybdate transport system substrate-binding protein
MLRLWFLACMGASICALGTFAQTVKVAAAISLKESLTKIAADYKAETGVSVEFTFGSSGQLAAQIQGGARIDLFISAANRQVEDLVKSGSVDAGSQKIVARNSLVLIAPKDSPDPPGSLGDLASQRIAKVAIGEPKSVPAGQYAMQALDRAKVADVLKDKLILGTNVRQVLDYVERGEVSAGIVYATDAKLSGDKVRLMSEIPSSLHEPIAYPSVLVKESPSRGLSEKFVEYLRSARAQSTLVDFGFAPAEPGASGEQ